MPSKLFTLTFSNIISLSLSLSLSVSLSSKVHSTKDHEKKEDSLDARHLAFSVRVGSVNFVE